VRANPSPAIPVNARRFPAGHRSSCPVPSHAQSERRRLYPLGGETLTRGQRRALAALVEEVGAMIRVASGLIATDVFPPAALASLAGSVTEAHAQLLTVTE
jgi:hypothetical protein